METKLERISQLSRENPNMVFTSIGHLINKEMLKSCHEAMDEEKAVGIDGVTKEEYSRNLNQNLESLVERLKKKSYKPKPARLVEIPKDNGKMRPLSIYSYEDKLVQEALRRILEAVFEPCFYDEMMGFRPNRSCHKAIQKLNTMIQSKPVNYVLDADIKGFFDHMDHPIHRIENQRSEYNPIGKANAESRNHERLSVRGHRRRKWAGLCMLTNHFMYIHALCADMVVPRESAAKPERICRISELCR